MIGGTLDALANCKNLRVLNCSGGGVFMEITGTLDALASCTSLTRLDMSNTKLEGQSARALGLVALNLHCKPPRPPMQIY